MKDEAAILLRVDHLETESGAGELADVADLSAAFAIERSAIEHDLDRLRVADFFHLVDKMILSENADDLPLGLGLFVAEEFRAAASLFSANRAGWI